MNNPDFCTHITENNVTFKLYKLYLNTKDRQQELNTLLYMMMSVMQNILHLLTLWTARAKLKNRTYMRAAATLRHQNVVCSAWRGWYNAYIRLIPILLFVAFDIMLKQVKENSEDE